MSTILASNPAAQTHGTDDEGEGGLDVILPLLKCPYDGSDLTWDRALGRLSGPTHTYQIDSGIPLIFAPSPSANMSSQDVTEIVKEFYEATPFPNYDGLDTRDSLRAKARNSVAAQLLYDQIPDRAKVLEVGCGTGQMTNFLGMKWGRTVVGSDICLNSLRLAADFRNRFAIRNAHFVQMNLFNPIFKDKSFDVIISNGVLHHTADAAGAFRSIAKLLKPGGYIVIGLYNSLGRLPTLWLRSAVKLFGDFAALADSRMRRERDVGRRKAWLMDQYKHPHETRHSIAEVLRWFEAAEFDFLSSIPTIGDTEFSQDMRLFEPHATGSYLDRLSTELELLLSGGVDGGLYIMIGRKRAGLQ